MVEKITCAIRSSEFNSDLKDYLFYGANVKLEKFIAFSLCKVLSKHGHIATLEKKKVDIAMAECKIEIKFHYDFDILYKLPKELNNLQCNLLDYYNQLCGTEISKTWMITFGVLHDIFYKACNMSIWVISERDYLSYKENLNLDDVCFAVNMRKLHERGTETSINEVIESFSTNLFMSRKHEFYAELVSFENPIISNVYFFIFDFRV